MTEATTVALKPYIFAPHGLATFTLGAACVIGFSEDKARDSLDSNESKLKAWADSFKINGKLFPALGMASTGLGLLAWKKTEQKDYLYGAIAMLSLLPFTLLFLRQTNNRLLSLDEKENAKKEGLTKPEEKEVQSSISLWVSLHRVRITALIIGAGFFYVAESKFLGKK